VDSLGDDTILRRTVAVEGEPAPLLRGDLRLHVCPWRIGVNIERRPNKKGCPSETAFLNYKRFLYRIIS
jgi:hypothetical protein